MTASEWLDIIIPPHDRRTPAAIWQDIFMAMQKLIKAENLSATALHDATVVPDRLLAEAAWELWEAYPDCARKTADALQAWTDSASPDSGHAVLILDALSLRELPFLRAGAQQHGIPIQVSITGAECPSDTETFAQKFGCHRADFQNNGKPAGFTLFHGKCCTDLLKVPFRDCRVPPDRNIVLWHTEIDDQIHQKQNLTAVEDNVKRNLDEGFWAFVDRIRQGRNLILTSDHGYAVTTRFPSEICNQDDVTLLRQIFAGSRCKPGKPPEQSGMLPMCMHHAGWNIVLGQRKWKGSRKICHGGMTLLEVLVPWIEFPAQ